MKSIRGRSLRPQLLAAYLEGEGSASDIAAVEAELSASSQARRQLGQLRSIRDALSSGEEDWQSVELLPLVRERIRCQAEVASLPPRSLFGRLVGWQRSALVATAVLALAAVGMPFALGAFVAPAREFREKSGSLELPSGRWAGIQAYRVRTGRAERLEGAVSRGDGLSFSYTNLGATPFGHLMIFAVDASGEVRWFYPAYERAGANPESIRIEKGAAEVALGELIQHDFAPGPLAIHALFTNQPLRVLEVESWLNRGQRVNLAERAPGLVEQVLTTRVEP